VSSKVNHKLYSNRSARARHSSKSVILVVRCSLQDIDCCEQELMQSVR